MADRPIIFSAPMVRALIAGRKTQTRRVMRQQDALRLAYNPIIIGRTVWNYAGEELIDRAVWTPGERLWVRENFVGARGYDALPPAAWGNKPIWYAADGAPDRERWWHLSDRTRPSIHMPRAMSRITLVVTDVRVQRLQEISEADARAEGIIQSPYEPDYWLSSLVNDVDVAFGKSPRDCFQALWNSIHGPDAWSANPWVAAITFRVYVRNIDAMTAEVDA